MELQQDLKNVRLTVSDKYKQLNVHSEEVEAILSLMDSRLATMEKVRKLKRLIKKEMDCEKEEVDNFFNEFENYKSMETIKYERNRHEEQIQHYDKKFDSE